MDKQKVIDDCIFALQDTMHLLQHWSGRLEQWREGQIEPADFAALCQELKEAGLWTWAANLGGHGITALGEAVGVLGMSSGVGPEELQ